MAKKINKPKQSEFFPEPKVTAKAQIEMTLAEAKAYRAALHKPAPKNYSEDQKKEMFRIWWAAQKSKYGRGKSLEKVLWMHLKSIDMASPEKFADGLANFGLKKVK